MRVSPVDGRLYVGGDATSLLSVFDLATSNLVGSATLSEGPSAMAFPYSGTTAFIGTSSNGQLARQSLDFSPATYRGLDANYVAALALQPNQAPTAQLAPASGTAGAPLLLDATASSDPDGSVASARWVPSDGSGPVTGTTLRTHTFATPGTYSVSVSVTDAFGCGDASTAQYDGRQMVCVGAPGATATRQVVVGRRAAQVALTCTAGTVAAAGTATCTATVDDSSAGTVSRPAGSVRLLVDGAPAGSCEVPAAGSTACSVTTPNAAVGVHSIVATYDGDAMHERATSTPVSVTYVAAPTEVSPVPVTKVATRIESSMPQRAALSAAGGLRVPCIVDAPTMTGCMATLRDARGKVVARAQVRGVKPTTRIVLAVVMSPQVRRFLASTPAGGRFRLEIVITQDAAPRQLRRVERVTIVAPLVIVVPTRGMFVADDATPTAAARTSVARIARQVGAAKRVVCSGFTSGVRTTAFGRRLSRARAQAVCRLLKANGVRAQFVWTGRGNANPIASNATEAGRERNRRVELAIYR